MLDGTVTKNTYKSQVRISKRIISKTFDTSGNLRDYRDGERQTQSMRHIFAFHCMTTYLGTEEEQAAGVSPEVWNAPYEKDHAYGDPTFQSSRQIRIIYKDDNLRADHLNRKCISRKR